MPQQLIPTEQKTERPEPRTVLAAKVVDTVLVRYTDETGREIVQLAIVGDNNVHLLDGRDMGFTRNSTPQGVANEWLRKGIFAKLGK